MVDPAFEMETEALVQILDQLDYFQILKIPTTSSPAEIKAAFYRESRVYHPDRHHALEDERFKGQVNRVYKRITEAYVTLRDDPKRARYLTDIAGPQRAQKLRFTEEDELATREAQKRQLQEQLGTTPKGRQLYQQALRDVQAGKLDAALRSLKLAASFEPETQLFKDKLREIEKALAADVRVK